MPRHEPNANPGKPLADALRPEPLPPGSDPYNEDPYYPDPYAKF